MADVPADVERGLERVHDVERLRVRLPDAGAFDDRYSFLLKINIYIYFIQNVEL